MNNIKPFSKTLIDYYPVLKPPCFTSRDISFLHSSYYVYGYDRELSLVLSITHNLGVIGTVRWFEVNEEDFIGEVSTEEVLEKAASNDLRDVILFNLDLFSII